MGRQLVDLKVGQWEEKWVEMSVGMKGEKLAE